MKLATSLRWMAKLIVPLAVLALLGSAFSQTRIVYLSAGSAEVEQRHDQKWVDIFNESQDEIVVQYELVSWADLFTRLYADLAAGTPPDVVWYGSTQIHEWHEMGILEPLNDWLGDATDAYLPHLIETGSDVVFNGEMYGAPFTQAARSFIVRRDWLEEAGFPPEELTTWDDFLEAAEAITDPAEGRYFTSISLAEDRMVGNALHFYFAPGFGLENAVDFREESRDAYIEMLDTIQRLGEFMPSAQTGWTHRDSIVSYVNETVAVALQGSFFQGDLEPLAPELAQPSVSAVIPVPAGGLQDTPSIAAYTVGYVMMNASENKEAAAEFIRFMIQPEVSVEWAMNVSPQRDVTIDDRVAALGEHVRWWEEEWNALFTGEDVELKAVPPYSPAGEINSIKARVIGDLLANRLTPEEAYEEMKSRVEAAKADN